MRKGLLVAAALGSTACEIYANPSPAVCPGKPVASFSFLGSQTAASCAFAGPSGQANTSFAFTGTVAFGADGGSSACLSQDVPQARLNLGTHSENFLDVSSNDTGAALNGCSCPTSVTLGIEQEITGDVLYGDGGTPAAFDGGMTTTVTAGYADGGSAGTVCCGSTLEDGGCSCGLPCTISYTMTGTTTLSPEGGALGSPAPSPAR